MGADDAETRSPTDERQCESNQGGKRKKRKKGKISFWQERFQAAGSGAAQLIGESPARVFPAVIA